VRPIYAEVLRYGEYAKPGESVYDHPFQWGSRRIGPDLQRVGGKYPDLWHVRHFENPRSTTPQSIMPPYSWLLTSPLDFAGIPAHMKAMRTLGVPYTEGDIGAGPRRRARRPGRSPSRSSPRAGRRGSKTGR